WQDVGDNSVQLVSNMQDGFYLIATDPVLVIDQENAIISQLASDVKAPVIKHLREAPPILKSKLADIYKNIIQQDINLDLPAPAGIKLITINEKPVPRLSLMRDPGVHVQPELIEDSHYMHLDFVYGQHKIPHFKPGDKWITFAENSKVEVIRNLADETHAKNAITHLGFVANELQEQLLFSNPSIPSRQEALQRWQNFLEKQIPLLRQQGWQVDIGETFKLKFDSNPEISVESSHENDWFSMSFDLEINGVKSPMVPLVSRILENVENLDQLPEKLLLELAEGHFVSVQTKDVKPILNILMELFDRKDKNGQITVSAFDAHLLVDLDGAVNWKGDKEILKLAKRIKKFTGINRVSPPKDLQLELRDYQRSGLDWLNFLYEFKFGGILADDMGLGKTVQTLAHIAKLKESGKLKKPSLIIVPTSLVANWKNEAKKFTPSLKLLVLYGPERFEQFSAVSNNDLVITSYALVVRDYELYKSIKFQYLILDEAQKIKNPKTKMTATINKLKSECRLALSGTPIENHLGELWSIFNFLMPGFLKNLSQFKSYYQNPIEKQQDTYKQQLLNKRIQPFMLRRKKEDVLLELPAKTEIIKYTQFESKQAKLYEAIRISMEKKVKDAIANKGLNKSHITILDALLKLRQVCCDPSLLKLAQAQKTKESAKLTLFMQLLEELLLENRKILVFSQFTSMLKILEAGIKSKKIKYTKLTGASRNREKIIQQFTDGQVDVFLISLKAGGVGLNLVEADTVIHYDPWWNPAVENQATDRAHRIGQNKQVFVYKLIVENTIEEKIIALQKKKQALQDGIYNKNTDAGDKKLSGNELMALLKPGQG
ncbi:DNA/RNA helicases, SNF2 family, partial [hydrothermal vent metagenome]